ncbi:MAG: threonine ammonia-lyase IlvA [Odoribacteraceae bacterium]|jgi:threonine dehydratase|nr:threonine ammonia-lyase IlvA [Odoribacteraceae bacterium]
MKPAYFPSLDGIAAAEQRLEEIMQATPLVNNQRLSSRYNATVLLKREDLQLVRSYKIRGAYNKIRSLPAAALAGGVACASAGNHAQGVAFSCDRLGITGTIFMPVTTPRQKINQVKMFGKDHVTIVLSGDTFDQANAAAVEASRARGITFIPPFDDPAVIEGQATVAAEIHRQARPRVDYVFVPVGGGGLASGLGAYYKQVSPATRVIGVEPAGAAGMKRSLEEGRVTTLDAIDKFVDGAAVQRVGDLTFEICREVLDDIITVPEGKVCTTILDLYNYDAIVVEPAGALAISALDFYRERLAGKTVACIVSGSNNDITRMEEIRERSLLYEGLKHYFVINFPQRAGALHDFVSRVLGPGDDITYFEYRKKTHREKGPALVGIEVQHPRDVETIIARLDEHHISHEYLNRDLALFEFMVT